jgi:oligopeptide/dipeptide ABC transporter ATP-binding protein
VTHAREPLLEIRGLRVDYGRGPTRTRAVDDVSLSVSRGERVGLVGESGSGKSSVAFAVTRLLRAPGEIVGGSAMFEGADLFRLDEPALNRIRGARLGMVYQDPFTFLNPLMRAGDQISEVLRAHTRVSTSQASHRAVQLIERLGLRPGSVTARKYPHQLSGGQRQRVVIAMAICAQPSLIIADEPTTALDVTVQAQILRLLLQNVEELGSSLLLISHDLAVIRLMCTRVYVMYAGEIVESGTTESLFSSPSHPYTAALVAASERHRGSDGQFPTIPGVPPDLRHPPSGCRFAERCEFRMSICATHPVLEPAGSGGCVACWLERTAS